MGLGSVIEGKKSAAWELPRVDTLFPGPRV